MLFSKYILFKERNYQGPIILINENNSKVTQNFIVFFEVIFFRYLNLVINNKFKNCQVEEGMHSF